MPVRLLSCTILYVLSIDVVHPASRFSWVHYESLHTCTAITIRQPSHLAGHGGFLYHFVYMCHSENLVLLSALPKSRLDGASARMQSLEVARVRSGANYRMYAQPCRSLGVLLYFRATVCSTCCSELGVVANPAHVFQQTACRFDHSGRRTLLETC